MDHWQFKCKTVYERNAHILKTEFRADCTFHVGSSEGLQIIKAHKTILAAASPVLDAMVYGDLAETKHAIVISDVEPATLHSLLWYVYTDKADIKSIEEAYQMYYAANKYILPGLQEVCIEYITKRLKPSNVCQVYEFSKFYERTDLKEKCLKMIGGETETVLGDESFLSLESQTVVDVYSMAELNISSELVLMRAVEKYDAAQSDITTPSGPFIRQAVKQIRFLSLTPQQFNDNSRSFTLLTPAEKYAIIANISSANSRVAMPEGFTTNRISRSPNSVQVSLNGTRHCYIRCRGQQDKLDVVRTLCDYYYSTIFCGDTERARKKLEEEYTAYVLREDMNSAQIQANLKRYYEVGNYLIAPHALATRIDMKEVGRTINYELPSVKEYGHTVARKRYFDGRQSVTMSLVSEDQMELVKHIQRGYGIEMKEIPNNGDIWEAIENYLEKK